MEVNEFSMHTLVRLHKLVVQNLVDWENIISDHLLKLQEKEVETKKEIEELNKENEMLSLENVQMWDDRVWLENAVSATCQEFLEITEDMDAEEKA